MQTPNQPRITQIAQIKEIMFLKIRVIREICGSIFFSVFSVASVVAFSFLFAISVVAFSYVMAAVE